MDTNSITDERLVRYALGDSEPGARSTVAEHVAGTPAAAEYVARVHRVVETMRTDGARPPRPEITRRIVEAWRRRLEPMRLAWLEKLDRFVATLRFDSRAQPALAGFRGESQDVQLAFDVEQARLDVQVSAAGSAAPDLRCVRGQVRPRTPGAVGAVALVESGSLEAIASAPADERGRFKLEAPPGHYDLLVELDQGVMIAPELEVD